MRKSMFILLLILIVLAPSLMACAIPEQRHPSDKPYNGDVPDPRPAGLADDWIGVRVYFYGHDRHDFDKPIVFRFNILAHAWNPELFGGFVEPDTGRAWAFRDPELKTDILVSPSPKTTNYGFTVWFPPTERIDFLITYGFEGEHGDVVGCEFQTAAGTTITATRTYAAVNAPESVGYANSSCAYVTNAADLD